MNISHIIVSELHAYAELFIIDNIITIMNTLIVCAYTIHIRFNIIMFYVIMDRSGEGH